MNIFLWVLQVLLALHTLMGAVWKFSHTADQSAPSLKALPQSVWMGLCGLEILVAVALVLPALSKSLGIVVPIAALCIAGEMLLFVAIHLASGAGKSGQLVYWLVVAAVSGFLAFARFVLRPL